MHTPSLLTVSEVKDDSFSLFSGIVFDRLSTRFLTFLFPISTHERGTFVHSSLSRFWMELSLRLQECLNDMFILSGIG